MVRRLAARGLVEYRLGRSRGGADQVVIEPQLPDYWPRNPKLRDSDVVVLSRFSYMRRRADEMVLESPRAGALFKIRDPKIAVLLAALGAARVEEKSVKVPEDEIAGAFRRPQPSVIGGDL
ncbi:MAG: hypothetical protein WBD83_21600, partial [Xanthobacteraceae bacterium]